MRRALISSMIRSRRFSEPASCLSDTGRGEAGVGVRGRAVGAELGELPVALLTQHGQVLHASVHPLVEGSIALVQKIDQRGGRLDEQVQGTMGRYRFASGDAATVVVLSRLPGRGAARGHLLQSYVLGIEGQQSFAESGELTMGIGEHATVRRRGQVGLRQRTPLRERAGNVIVADEAAIEVRDLEHPGALTGVRAFDRPLETAISAGQIVVALL